jgi:shikimate kinase
MWPFCGELASPTDGFKPGQQVFDTIYNPAATKWVLQAKKYGARASGGLPMLFWQAAAAQKIWNPDRKFDQEQLLSILPELSREMLHRFPVKYVFTGFMGAGKTTISREAAGILKIPVYDLDEQIEKTRGCTVSEIFARDGEAGFRKMEAAVLEELLSMEGSALIAAGGGAVIQEQVRANIRSHGAMVIYLHASLDCLWTRVGNKTGRPLLGDVCDEESSRFSKAACLYGARLPIYENYCDIKINAEEAQDAVVSQVISALGYGG